MWIGNSLAWLLLWFRGCNPRGGPNSGAIHAGILPRPVDASSSTFDFLIFAVPKILLAWQAGITLGRYIIVRRDVLPAPQRKVAAGAYIPRGIVTLAYGPIGYDGDALERLPLIRHELVHIRQWQRYGWTFLPRYIWGWIFAGFSYRQNPLEKEAYGDE